ncbi:MAG: chromosome segregation protein SMC [Myxococcota bacterium]
MRIKSLQVHGFKSFVDRTVFSFQDGITAVVGPNGCGKSNVVDAVRWVMGEQSPRRLRGKGMDDVIFAGSETRPPIGMAEVVLAFDNTDGQAPATYAAYSEIQICRRLYRSGESEYQINKSPCRLRDIQDFFRDSGIGAKGYTIVEQGKIAEIVSAKPEDRRMLIEEAAGISKYKARRREAESKIASTEQNLVRVTDVLGEIKRQIASLERQARKAARFKRLQETQRVLDLSLSKDERADLEAAVGQASERLQSLRDQVTALETGVSERELKVEERRIALAESEKAVNAGSERLVALRGEIRELEGRTLLARQERETLAESNEGRRQELSQLHDKLRDAEAEAAQAAEEQARLEEALANENETVSAAESEARAATESLRTLERERDQANEAFVAVLTSVARAEDRSATVEDRGAEIDQRLRSADRELEVQQSEAAQADDTQRNLEEGLRNLLAERDRLQDALIKALNEQQRAADEAGEASERLRQLREQHEARKARLDSLREVIESREDVSDAARFVLSREEADRQRWGVRGLVREMLDADAEVETAVEAVLADRAEAVVVAGSDGALGALAALRDGQAGRGVFLLEPSKDAIAPGIVPLGQPVLERVRPRAGHEAVVQTLLADVNLVESLEEPLRIYAGGRLPATFVTPGGDVLSPDGVLRGGGAAAGHGSLARAREVRELETEVARRGAEVAEAERVHQEIQERVARVSEQLDNLRNRHHTAALAVANHEKDLERTRERVKAIGEAREGRVSERSELLAESEALSGERERLALHLEDARGERARRQRELDALGLKISAAARDASRLETRLTELRVAQGARVEQRDRLAQQAERARTTLAETREWMDRREREIAAAEERRGALAVEIEQHEASLAELLEREEAARRESDALRERFEADTEAVRSVEEEVRRTRSELVSQREEASNAELKVRENELHLQHLDDAVRERWGVELQHWSPPDPDGIAEGADGAEATGDEAAEEAPAAGEPAGADTEEGDEELAAASSAQALRDARQNAELARAPREERQRRLDDIRSKLQSLGDVNLGAIEEHEELAERSRFLSEQKADLENTIQSLREAIARINRTSRKRFRETFEAVSKRFSENFPRIFGGGKASLMLTDAEDILEAGVDIMSQPPGKRLQNVNLLSGGEKTMTALALLVSVFQVRPSPFFLLDEVDAALDDANVGRFNALVSEMATESQFLVITHNKRTIEVADVLYGVTMEMKGVSKLVAVELH